jgi:predicted  nucleic acid-binding Zn-ribbon protein
VVERLVYTEDVGGSKPSAPTSFSISIGVEGEKMKAAPSDQLQVLDIQRMDFAVATLRNKLAGLPEIAELSGITQRLTVVRDLAIAAETQISDIKRELLRAEADVEQVVTRLERDEKRLMEGNANPKELEKLQHEVQTLTVRRSELEEVELEIMLRSDSIKERLAELRTEEATRLSASEEIHARKAVASEKIQSEIASLTEERKAIETTVDGALLVLYEKIRSNDGTGAAAMREGRCDGCHLPINSVEISRIKSLPTDEVVRCEECRCILVRGAK